MFPFFLSFIVACLNGESDPVIHTFSEKTEVCFAELTPDIIKGMVHSKVLL